MTQQYEFRNKILTRPRKKWGINQKPCGQGQLLCPKV